MCVRGSDLQLTKSSIKPINKNIMVGFCYSNSYYQCRKINDIISVDTDFVFINGISNTEKNFMTKSKTHFTICIKIDNSFHWCNTGISGLGIEIPLYLYENFDSALTLSGLERVNVNINRTNPLYDHIFPFISNNHHHQFSGSDYIEQSIRRLVSICSNYLDPKIVNNLMKHYKMEPISLKRLSPFPEVFSEKRSRLDEELIHSPPKRRKIVQKRESQYQHEEEIPEVSPRKVSMRNRDNRSNDQILDHTEEEIVEVSPRKVSMVSNDHILTSIQEESTKVIDEYKEKEDSISPQQEEEQEATKIFPKIFQEPEEIQTSIDNLFERINNNIRISNSSNNFRDYDVTNERIVSYHPKNQSQNLNNDCSKQTYKKYSIEELRELIENCSKDIENDIQVSENKEQAGSVEITRTKVKLSL